MITRRRCQLALSIVTRWTTWAAVTVAAAATATVVTASPASASSDIIKAVSEGHGWATFNEQTGELTLKDTSADGYGIAVEYFRSDVNDAETEMIAWDRHGSGKYAHYHLHMVMGATISFHVCAEDDGVILVPTRGPRGFGTYLPII